MYRTRRVASGSSGSAWRSPFLTGSTLEQITPPICVLQHLITPNHSYRTHAVLGTGQDVDHLTDLGSRPAIVIRYDDVLRCSVGGKQEQRERDGMHGSEERVQHAAEGGLRGGSEIAAHLGIYTDATYAAAPEMHASRATYGAITAEMSPCQRVWKG